MKTLGCILLSCGAALAAHAETADDQARKEANVIIQDIAAICETKGLEACEPNLRGMEPLFAYLRARREMEITEKEFVAFVRDRYSMPDFTMDKMAAHLNPRLNVTISRQSFEGKIQKATRVAGGYDAQMSDGLVKLRREKEAWVAYLPEVAQEKMGTVRLYTSAARLKRSIMTYRKLQAELLNYDLDEFATRFVQDLGPLTVAVLRREDLVAQMPDWEQRLDKVVEFYSQFKSVEDMRAEILASRKSTK